MKNIFTKVAMMIGVALTIFCLGCSSNSTEVEMDVRPTNKVSSITTTTTTTNTTRTETSSIKKKESISTIKSTTALIEPSTTKKTSTTTKETSTTAEKNSTIVDEVSVLVDITDEVKLTSKTKTEPLNSTTSTKITSTETLPTESTNTISTLTTTQITMQSTEITTQTDTQPTETTTNIVTTIETQPTETQSVETQPTETQSVETQPTETITDAQTTEVTTAIEPIITTTTEEVYVVYKPLTHYIHKNTCYWAKIDYVYRIENTDGIVCRKCSECNPDMEIKEYYTEGTTSSTTTTTMSDTTTASETTTTTTETSTTTGAFAPEKYGLTDSDVLLLRKIVSSEYGADWVPVEEKAKVVASVMNQVYSSNPYYPDNILGCLNRTCTPWGFNPNGDYYISNSTIEAVEYYFLNRDTVFADWHCEGWWGDGRANHFYYYSNGRQVYQCHYGIGYNNCTRH